MSSAVKIAAMVFGAAVFVALIAFGVHSSANDNTKELQLLHVIMRHGIRTPASTYPKDPYINATFNPVGWGQITNQGKLELYNTGKYLRERYDKFLDTHYSPQAYYAQATDVDRTKVSVQVLNAGLWPPKGEQKWGPLDWQPIPVHSEPLHLDSLLLVRKPCAQYSLELQRLENTAEIQQELDRHKQLFDELEVHTGKIVRTFEDVQDIYTTLLAEQAFNLTLPEWTRDYFPEKMREPAEFSYTLNAYNTKLKRLKGGVLLKKLLNDWESKINGTIKPEERKMFLYAGHDSTIANVLSALDVWDPQVPGYGVAILLELSKDVISGAYGIEIYLRNSTTREPYQLVVPGCESFCPIQKLIELTRSVIPENWEQECHTDDPNYVPPPPGGP